MLNFKDLGDMAKLAGQAKELQQEHQKTEQRKIEILAKISQQLDEIVTLLKEK